MNISVCITVLNEEETIGRLLDSLMRQTRKPEEIVIVDGGSKDKTVEIINHYQKRFSGLKLLKGKCSRARGRNLGIEIARGEIIAITDAGCIARPDWLEKITGPFVNKEIEVAAGFYQMVAKTPTQKAMRAFLGVTPDKFDVNFLPSTRSVAFRKGVWEKVGGFPENLPGAAEDTAFNYKLIKNNAKISRVKDAVVEWGMPETIFHFSSFIFHYAKGDAKSKIWIFPGKGLTSHNIKAVLVIVRYLLGLILLIYSFSRPVFALYLSILISLYLFRAYRKAGPSGIPLQLISDFAVMSGFLAGILRFRD